MNQAISKAIDIIGKCLLVWFLYETLLYIFTGNMIAQIKQVPFSLQSGATFWGIYTVIKIPVAAAGVFPLAFLILKGNIFSLLVGLAYWAMGNLINPLWYFMSRNMQVTPEGHPSTLLLFANYFWSGITLLILVVFYLHRKSLRSARKESLIN